MQDKIKAAVAAVFALLSAVGITVAPEITQDMVLAAVGGGFAIYALVKGVKAFLDREDEAE